MDLKVLVVDDDPATLSMLEFSLVLEGFDVITATDGASALEVSRQLRPDIILLDVMMPVLSGLDVAGELRKDGELCTTPIIILSARSAEDDVWAGWKRGVDSYIPKPLDVSVLMDEIGRLTSSPLVEVAA